MKYIEYSLESKVQTIIDYLQLTEKISLNKFSRDHSVHPNTFRYWLKKYNEKTLTVDLRENNHRPSLITDTFKNCIDETMAVNGLQSILRIRATLVEQFPYSLSTYYKIVHLMDYTYKRVSTYTLPIKKNIATVLEQIAEKQRELCAIGIENVVSIDEVPFYEEMFPTYGWSKCGKKCIHRKNSMRSKHHSVLCAVSSSGQFEYRIVDSGNGDTFKAFIAEVVIPKFKDKSHFLMDNARIHHCKDTVEYIKDKGFTPIYTVPYTPELNPIENCFSVIKKSVRYDLPKTFQELELAIESSIPVLTQEKCTNMFRKSFGLTDYEIIR